MQYFTELRWTRNIKARSHVNDCPLEASAAQDVTHMEINLRVCSPVFIGVNHTRLCGCTDQLQFQCMAFNPFANLLLFFFFFL